MTNRITVEEKEQNLWIFTTKLGPKNSPWTWKYKREDGNQQWPHDLSRWQTWDQENTHVAFAVKLSGQIRNRSWKRKGSVRPSQSGRTQGVWDDTLWRSPANSNTDQQSSLSRHHEERMLEVELKLGRTRTTETKEKKGQTKVRGRDRKSQKTMWKQKGALRSQERWLNQASF